MNRFTTRDLRHPYAHKATRTTAIALPQLRNPLPWLILAALLFLSSFSFAQQTLVGLTSNGGPEGKGTAFSVKTDGTNYSIVKSFADWGKAPTGGLVQASDGFYYGMTNNGGIYNHGTIFRISASGEITIVKNLYHANDGSYPGGSLIVGPDGDLFGMTSSGGVNGNGTIFRLSLTGNFTVLKSLAASTEGSSPKGQLLLASDGNFYGITYAGGTYGYGTIFRMTPSGTLTVLKSFNRPLDGGNSYGSLIQAKDGNLYGIAYGGGTNNFGTIFKITLAGVYTVVRNLSVADGTGPRGSLVQGTDGNFYGLTYGGGTYGYGTVFKLTTGGVFTVIKHFLSGTDGGFPNGTLIQNSDGYFYGTTSNGGPKNYGTIFKINSSGTFTMLRSLVNTTDGAYPKGNLLKGSDGYLYGMASDMGPSFYGTVFKINTTGTTFTVLSKLNGSAVGNAPMESLYIDSTNAFYGTTSFGGAYNYGTVFKICAGVTTVIRAFNRNTDGAFPKSGLIKAKDGNYYGVAGEGGSTGAGTIFKITPSGTFTVIRHLTRSTDGANPQGNLIEGKDGSLYGMTSAGGTNGVGTIFKITTAGVFTVLRHLLLTTDGGYPEGNLVEGADGNFYGITYQNPRIFKITPAGVFTVVYTLKAGTDGNAASGGLIVGKDGNFYGTASSGGQYSGGTIFKMTPAGVFTPLRALNPKVDGSVPKANLVQAADGFLYGTTSAGGANNVGTIFKISTAGIYAVLRHLNLVTDGGVPMSTLRIRNELNLVANPQSISTAEDIAKAITLTGSGATSLTFTIVTAPKNGTVTAGTAAARKYTPKANFSGKDSFYFTSNVGCYASAPAKVVITVAPVNDTPVLAVIGNKTVAKGTALTFKATATDVDAGQTKTFSLITPPAGATMVASTGAFTWTPTVAGTFTFKVRVTDNGSPVLFDEEQITVTVTATAPIKTAAVASEEMMIEKIQTNNLPLAASLFPNPVSDRLFLSLNSDVNEMKAMISDINGVLVRVVNVQPKGGKIIEIDTRNLVAGQYVLQLHSDRGNAVIRFVKL